MLLINRNETETETEMPREGKEVWLHGWHAATPTDMINSEQVLK